MNTVNHAMPNGMAMGQLDRLSSSSPPRTTLSPETDFSVRRPHHVSTDEIHLSHRARSFQISRPIDLPRPEDPGGNSDLATSIRKVGQFLKEHPRMADSPFGQAVQLVMRGAIHLVKNDGAGAVDGFPPGAEKNLQAAVGKIQEFLDDHPRVANSPFGKAVSQMGRAVVTALDLPGNDPGMSLKDKITQAAKQVHRFLEAHPKMAAMPLGQAVEKLINGVREMGENLTLDTETHTLAKRISHYIGQHPRLAGSEFGQLVSNLTRGLLALDTTIPPDVEPPVVGDIRPGVAVPAVNTDLETTLKGDEADLKKAA